MRASLPSSSLDMKSQCNGEHTRNGRRDWFVTIENTPAKIMTGAIPDILSRVVQVKREALARGPQPLDHWERLAETRLSERRGFSPAPPSPTPAIIDTLT